MKTTLKQELLELKRQNGIGEIIKESLERFRGSPNFVVHVCLDLEISSATFYKWCQQAEIEIEDYRTLLPVGSQT